MQIHHLLSFSLSAVKYRQGLSPVFLGACGASQDILGGGSEGV